MAVAGCGGWDGQTHHKTIVFIRHGESDWNEMFNKGFWPIGFTYRVLRGVIRELLFFATTDSVFYDSPLSQEGVDQARCCVVVPRTQPRLIPAPLANLALLAAPFLACVDAILRCGRPHPTPVALSPPPGPISVRSALQKWLRGGERSTVGMSEACTHLFSVLNSDPDESKSIICSSNLRRALATTTIGLWGRLKRTQEQVWVLSELQASAQRTNAPANAHGPRRIPVRPMDCGGVVAGSFGEGAQSRGAAALHPDLHVHLCTPPKRGQEMSRNVDTIALAGAKATPRLPVLESELGPQFAPGQAEQWFNNTYNSGNKSCGRRGATSLLVRCIPPGVGLVGARICPKGCCGATKGCECLPFWFVVGRAETQHSVSPLRLCCFCGSTRWVG